jgi:two-component system, NtrC family, response regulator HydG
MKRILVIDDDVYICNLLVGFLNKNGYKAEGTFSGINGKKMVDEKNFDLVLCDYRLPNTDGFKILQHIKSKKPATMVIIMTAYAEINTAVKLIKAGAFDYVTKPIQPEEILQLIKRASAVKKNVTVNFDEEFITGSSEQIKDVLKHCNVVAPTKLTVLIEGETGSGKEYIARAIHQASKRSKKSFVPVDCGAIPKELANSELFGHIKGAFTGASDDKTGYFEQAKGGTLFLDEIGNLPYENQVKMLRALQEKVINKVGGNKNIKVDVRLLVATNENLLKLVEANEFREDLYHRINGFKIKLPSLRERKEDIKEFTGFFIRKANASFGKNIKTIDDEVKTLFYQYSWPGNIRELQNVINRTVLLTQGEYITTEVLPEEIRFCAMQDKLTPSSQQIQQPGNGQDLKQARYVTEKEVISNALITSNFNKSKAAKMLNIDRKTLYNKIKFFEIDAQKNKSAT